MTDEEHSFIMKYHDFFGRKNINFGGGGGICFRPKYRPLEGRERRRRKKCCRKEVDIFYHLHCNKVLQGKKFSLAKYRFLLVHEFMKPIISKPA
jgi:hypothetical protein